MTINRSHFKTVVDTEDTEPEPEEAVVDTEV